MEKLTNLIAWAKENPKKAGLYAFGALFVIVFITSPSQITSELPEAVRTFGPLGN